MMRRFVSEMRLAIPPQAVWDYYVNLDHLLHITLPRMHLSVLRADTPLRIGSRVLFCVKRGPVPIHWESQITLFEPPHRFADAQIHGPFRAWIHTHEFLSLEEGRATLVRDSLEWELPGGLLGLLTATARIDEELRDLFAYREKKVREILETQASNP